MVPSVNYTTQTQLCSLCHYRADDIIKQFVFNNGVKYLQNGQNSQLFLNDIKDNRLDVQWYKVI